VPLPWASVTKLATALACWIAMEEGTIDLDDPAGPEGSTVRHLLAHASRGRRIYSNEGYEVLADHLAAAAAMPFEAYLREAVLDPLHLTDTRLDGSAGSGMVGPIDDLVRLAAELRVPTLVAPPTLALATTVAFPGLGGVLPGFGRQDPNDWGLGPELKSTKAPHWTAPSGSPRTYGHFGQAGGFCWIDPDAGVACAVLTDEPFGDWARAAWPAFSQTVLDSAA
jgi:CubicO group peptidase (beta-lactamase class C family)